MNLFKKIEITVSSIGAFLLFVSTVLSGVNAIARYGFNYSMSWADEISVYGIVISVFLMQCRLEAHGEQLSINVLEPYVKKWPIITDLMFWVRGVVTIFVWQWLIRTGWETIVMNYELSTVTSLLMFPMWIIFSAYTLGMLLILVAWVWLIQRKLRGLSTAMQGGAA